MAWRPLADGFSVAAVYDRRQSLLSTSRAVIDRPYNGYQEQPRHFMKVFPKTSRFLVDEDLGYELAPALRRLGFNAIEVFRSRVERTSDDDVFATAWKEGRIVLTQDRHFPPNVELIKALLDSLPLVRNGPDLWRGAKIVVAHDGRLVVTNCNHDTGARETTYYKLRRDGPPLMWIPDK